MRYAAGRIRPPVSTPVDNAVLDPALAVPQQPRWEDSAQVTAVRTELSQRPALVRSADVRALRRLLADVAAGRAHVVQAGDCAEDPRECTARDVARKVAVLDLLAANLAATTRRPVVRVGRIAGQFSKPRSSPTERVGGVDLPVYRGHMINGPKPDLASRRPDPARMLTCYDSAAATMGHLRSQQPLAATAAGQVWTSHEALLLDYELAMLRRDEQDELLLTSTHWPWIGERTRQPDGQHVAMLAQVTNPVACKIGPGTTEDDLTALSDRLDPLRTPGRLTFIARMGAEQVAERLPALVSAARATAHPVIWLCDPMHGNGITLANGIKTRFTCTMITELRLFQQIVTEHGGIAGGLHLETTPDEVSECVSAEYPVEGIDTGYQSLCDPRLNSRQAVDIVSAWRSATEVRRHGQ